MQEDLLDRLRRSPVVGRYFEASGDLVVVSGGDGSADDEDDGDDTDDQQDHDQDQSQDDDQQDDEGDDDKPLGPKGEKAYQAEKQKRRDAQKQLREWKALGLSPADIKKLIADKSGDDDPDPDQIRDEAKAEARAEVMRDRIMDKIEAKAARLFADPDDAAALLMRGREIDEFLDDGKIDVEEIETALNELIETKPYLAAQGGPRFKGDADGGTRKESGPKQLSRTDLERMSPQEIEKARREGRLERLLTGKTT